MRRVLLRKLRRDLLQRKGSFAALIVIVAIGTGVFIAMNSVWHDMDRSRSNYYALYRLAQFRIDLKRAPVPVLGELARLPNVAEVQGRIEASVLVDLPGLHEPIPGRAISLPASPRPVLNDVLLRSGTWFSSGRENQVILNDAFARANGLRPGNRIRVLLLDKQHDLLVVGTAMSPEFVYLIPESGALAPDPQRFAVMYLPERFLRETYSLEGAYNEILGLVHDDSSQALRNTIELCERKLDAYGVLNAVPMGDVASVRFLADELKGLRVTSRVMPAIFLGVATLVLNVLMGRLVRQQRTVVGTLKALGYSTRQVFRHYLGYGLVVGAAGGAGGMVFGYWLQGAMLEIYRRFYNLPDLRLHFYPGIYLGGLAISMAFAVVGTLGGVRRAARLAPAEAMRASPPEKGGKVFVERFGWLWGLLSFRGKMAVRTVLRNPFRSGVNVTAAFVSTAIVVIALIQVDSLDYLMSYEFEKVAHEDVSVALRDPKPLEALGEVSRLSSVSGVEAQLEVAARLTNGPYTKLTAVTGLGRPSRLYTPLDRRGQPIAVPEAGLVLSKKLAELLHVGRGDTLQLRPLIGQRQSVRAPVIGIVDTYLGLQAYADLEYLSRLIGEARVTNKLLLSTFAGAGEQRLSEELKERPTVLGVEERLRALRQLQGTFGETMGTMITFMVLIAGIIAFGSVFNTALVSLGERQREIATLRALGYTTAQVGRMFSGESLLLNAVGILLGLAGGVGLAHLIAMAYNTELFRFPVIVYVRRLVEAVLVMLGFVFLAQLLLWRMIWQLDWLEAIKVKE